MLPKKYAARRLAHFDWHRRRTITVRSSLALPINVVWSVNRFYFRFVNDNFCTCANFGRIKYVSFANNDRRWIADSVKLSLMVKSVCDFLQIWPRKLALSNLISWYVFILIRNNIVKENISIRSCYIFKQTWELITLNFALFPLTQTTSLYFHRIFRT